MCPRGMNSRLVGAYRASENRLMARTTVTFTISLPPAMGAELEEMQRKEHRTRSELVREALRWYISTNRI